MNEPPSQSAAQTSLNYKGAAFDNHTLDLRNMGDAMNGIRTLLEKAASVRNEPTPNTRVRVKDGSVIFDLSCMTQAKDSLLAVSDPVAIFDLVFKMEEFATKAGNAPIVISSLLGLALWLENRKIKSRKDIGGDRYQITASDNATIIVNAKVVQMADDKQVRQAVRGVVAPLNEPESEKLIIKRSGHPEFPIHRKEGLRIGIGDPESETGTKTQRKRLNILHAPLAVEHVRGKKKPKENFHFEDRAADEKFWAEINAGDFMNRFRTGDLRLAYGTELDCDIEETWENLHDGEEPKIKRRCVTQVHQVIHPREQMDFFDGK